LKIRDKLKLIWVFRKWIKPKIIWALWKARKPILNIIREVKKIMADNTTVSNEPGKYTSEFFLVVFSNVITLIGALKGIIGPELTAGILAVLNGIYTIIRTWRKNSADKKEVELKKIEAGPSA